jgi:hypothetical protein
MKRLFVIALAALAAGYATAQDYGDTPYVQTPQNVVDRMLELARVGPKDYVIDLGSGDGRMVITAAKKHGARGFGVDLDRRLVALANRNAKAAGVAGRAEFYERDIYATDLSPASVVTIYLLPEVNLMMRPRLLAMLKPGSRVVSHDYAMGEWQPDVAFEMDAPGKPVGRDQKSKVFYWTVPGNAAGRWSGTIAGGTPVELDAGQMFQQFDGTVSVGGRSAAIAGGRLTGEDVEFTARVEQDGAAVAYAFTGRISGQSLSGKVRVTRGGATEERAWEATRVELRPTRHSQLPPPTLVPPPVQ